MDDLALLIGAALEYYGKYDVARRVHEMIKEGQILFVPFPRSELFVWHIYQKNRADKSKGYTKRLVSWEQMVAGIAKDPDAIYAADASDANTIIKMLKEDTYEAYRNAHKPTW